MSFADELKIIEAEAELANRSMSRVSAAVLKLGMLKFNVDCAALVVDLHGEREVMRRLLNECHALMADLVETEGNVDERRVHMLSTQIEDAISRIYSPVTKRLNSARTATYLDPSKEPA